MVYPAYINANKKLREGRKLPVSLCVADPIPAAMAACCANKLKLETVLENNKTYPRDFFNPGRIRVNLFKGKVDSGNGNEDAVMKSGEEESITSQNDATEGEEVKGVMTRTQLYKEIAAGVPEYTAMMKRQQMKVKNNSSNSSAASANSSISSNASNNAGQSGSSGGNKVAANGGGKASGKAGGKAKGKKKGKR